MPRKLSDINQKSNPRIDLSNLKEDFNLPQATNINSAKKLTQELNSPSKKSFDLKQNSANNNSVFIPEELPFHKKITKNIKLFFLASSATLVVFIFVLANSYGNYQNHYQNYQENYEIAQEKLQIGLNLANNFSLGLAKLNFNSASATATELISQIDQSYLGANIFLSDDLADISKNSKIIDQIAKVNLAKTNLITAILPVIDNLKSSNFNSSFSINLNELIPNFSQTVAENLNLLENFILSAKDLRTTDQSLSNQLTSNLNQANLFSTFYEFFSRAIAGERQTYLLGFKNDLVFIENIPRLKAIFEIQFLGLDQINIKPLPLPSSSTTLHRFVFDDLLNLESKLLVTDLYKSPESDFKKLILINFSDLKPILTPNQKAIIGSHDFLRDRSTTYFAQVIQDLFVRFQLTESQKEIYQNTVKLFASEKIYKFNNESAISDPLGKTLFIYGYNSNLNSPQQIKLKINSSLKFKTNSKTQISLDIDSELIPIIENFSFLRQLDKFTFNSTPTETKLSFYLPLNADQIVISGLSKENYSIAQGPLYKVVKMRINSKTPPLNLTYTVDNFAEENLKEIDIIFGGAATN